MRVNACNIRGVVLRGKQSEAGWQKKADYQEGLEKSRPDSAARSRDNYMKDPEKIHARSRESYMKDPEKSRADSAARSHKSYKKDLEKSRDDNAARSRASYLKDPEKSRARNRKNYMKDPEESCWQCSMKPRKLQERLGEESLKWNWLGYILQK